MQQVKNLKLKRQKDNEEFSRIRYLTKNLMEDLESLAFLEMIIRFKDFTN